MIFTMGEENQLSVLRGMPVWENQSQFWGFAKGSIERNVVSGGGFVDGYRL